MIYGAGHIDSRSWGAPYFLLASLLGEPELAESLVDSGFAAGVEGAPSPFLGAPSLSFAPCVLASFLGELYRSEYHPPPRSTKELRLTTLVKVPCAPQLLHRSGGGSFIFCRTSLTFPHLSQTYSYIGMDYLTEMRMRNCFTF